MRPIVIGCERTVPPCTNETNLLAGLAMNALTDSQLGAAHCFPHYPRTQTEAHN
jgi:hypothetical protein